MKTTPNSSKNMMLDLALPIAFYVAYVLSNLIIATIVLVAVSVLVITFNKIVLKKGSKIVYLSTALLVFFGGLTIFSGDTKFIKMKPTIVYILFSISIVADSRRKNSFCGTWICKTFMTGKLAARKITNHFAVFWLSLACLNEIIWRNFDESTWVLMKSFGFTGLNILFFLYCYFWIAQPRSG